MEKKRVYSFGDGKAEGRADMRNLLGGKGANLAEMNLIGVPVPPGFTITTDVCSEYYSIGGEEVRNLLNDEVKSAIKGIETLMSHNFGDPSNPLLVSVRSGARASMPGMMDTILNLGLNDEVVAGLSKKTGNERFAWDSYRRFVQMYGDVVLGMKPAEKTEQDPFEAIIEQVKEEAGVKLDNELSVENLKDLVVRFKKAVYERTGKDFPADPYEQLWGAVMAVFNSWMNERAILYRKMEGIPAEWGTAVTVQAMVFGNMGNTSATGVCFSRDAGNGENLFNGEYLINAQGEDVVAGIRTPQQITKIGSQRWAERGGISEADRAAKYPSMEECMPEIYAELNAIQQKLEDHYSDMQDMEFTVQEGKLWLLQTRNGKRTGSAMVKIACDLLHEGDRISINGTTGEVFLGEVATVAAEMDDDFRTLMTLADKHARLQVRTNADTPRDAATARSFGAVGIGLCRTEHMFFEAEKIKAMREMILSENEEGRVKALEKILPYQRKDFYEIFKVMQGLPVTVRLLDPPLHEFVPHDVKQQEEMAEAMGIDLATLTARIEKLNEQNPMLGHRGCRLGNTFPEITRMQTRAILGACCQLQKEGIETHPEIMVPLVGILYEFKQQEEVIRATAEKVFEEEGVRLDFKVGTMIEIPRAALTADRIASSAEFFSFGTNDLTQMTFGYSRDDIASFLPHYLEQKILKVDPFQVLDQKGVGQLISMATERGRAIRPELKVGICGEHGGEPSSVKFCHRVGLNYVSCSPFRVPIARVAAAQAAIEERK